MQATATRTFGNNLAALVELAAFVEGFAVDHQLPMEVHHAFNVALDELLTNVITHGYEDEAEHAIGVTLGRTANHVFAQIEDDGRPFNPVQVPPPTPKQPGAVHIIGGVGIHLVRGLMDSITYRRHKGKNQTTLRRKIPPD